MDESIFDFTFFSKYLTSVPQMRRPALVESATTYRCLSGAQSDSSRERQNKHTCAQVCTRKKWEDVLWKAGRSRGSAMLHWRSLSRDRNRYSSTVSHLLWTFCVLLAFKVQIRYAVCVNVWLQLAQRRLSVNVPKRQKNHPQRVR